MKTFFYVGIFLLLTTTVFSATINIGKTNGGFNGYNTVIEKHDGDKHALVCYDPGNACCEWMIRPNIVGPHSNPEWNDLEQYANNQVASGNLSGSYINNIEINSDFWGRSVQWEGTTTGNVTVNINIELITYPN
jgi:hypothetical protein